MEEPEHWWVEGAVVRGERTATHATDDQRLLESRVHDEPVPRQRRHHGDLRCLRSRPARRASQVARRSRRRDRRRPGPAARDPRRRTRSSRRRRTSSSPRNSERWRSVVLPRCTRTRPRSLCHWNLPDAHALESWGDVARLRRHRHVRCSRSSRRSTRAGPRRRSWRVHRRADRQAGARIVKDYWTRAHGGGRGWTIRDPPGQAYTKADASGSTCAARRVGAGTAVADGGQGTPFKPGPKAPCTRCGSLRPRHAAGRLPLRNSGSVEPYRRRQRSRHPRRPPQQKADTSSSPLDPACYAGDRRRARDHLPARPDDLGRPLREQRLAAGAAEAADEDHVGPDGVGQPGARRSSRAQRRRHHRAPLPRQHGAAAGRVVPGHPDGAVTAFFGYGRQLAGRVGTPPTMWRRSSTSIAAHLRRAVVRQRTRIAKTGDRYLMARTQEHHPMEGRARSASPRSRSTSRTRKSSRTGREGRRRR